MNFMTWVQVNKGDGSAFLLRSYKTLLYMEKKVTVMNLCDEIELTVIRHKHKFESISQN